jgi:hypothetical protein
MIKKNLSYADYAKKSFQNYLLRKLLIIHMKTVTIQESVIAINKGGGQFEIKVLPKEVQFSSVDAICAMDINKDGILDIVLGGNEYEFKPQFSRLDTNYGSVLLGIKMELIHGLLTLNQVSS